VVLYVTPQERTALELLANGADPGVLADRFRLNEQAVEAQLTSLFARMGVRSLAEALFVAARRGLLTGLEQRQWPPAARS
jgi:DNA-binding CsgD family transcriptional regulator